jgi:hypothetical protein
MKLILGIGIIVFIFGAIFIAVCKAGGLKMALFVFGVSICGTGLIVLANYLIAG